MKSNKLSESRVRKPETNDGYGSDISELEQFEWIKHRLFHNAYIWFELQYGVNLNNFVTTIDPLKSFAAIKQLQSDAFLQGKQQSCQQCTQMQQALIAAASLSRSINQALSAPPPIAGEQTVQQNRQWVYQCAHPNELPIVIDTGASMSLTPNINDFVGKIRSPTIMELKGLVGPFYIRSHQLCHHANDQCVLHVNLPNRIDVVLGPKVYGISPRKR
jgi:hypothetical protein